MIVDGDTAAADAAADDDDVVVVDVGVDVDDEIVTVENVPLHACREMMRNAKRTETQIKGT